MPPSPPSASNCASSRRSWAWTCCCGTPAGPSGSRKRGSARSLGRAGPCRLRRTFAPWRAKAGAAAAAHRNGHQPCACHLPVAARRSSPSGSRFPKVRITVLQGTPGQTADLVRDGKATLGVTHAPGELPKETVAVPFLTSQRVLVAPAGHPLLKEEGADAGEDRGASADRFALCPARGLPHPAAARRGRPGGELWSCRRWIPT
jgi:DNA-binding transcriptional LysR family regulator